MPIYEYKCEDCGSFSEILVKNRANVSSVTCPDCDSGNLEKLISAPGAVMTKGGASSGMPEPRPCPTPQQCGRNFCGSPYDN
ncbi:MAG: zinc ribbon domain-containing protein [bacterium]|nr:zinc ribbon domain-containing protein [bacterium]